MQEPRRESIPEAWMGQRVTLEGAPHAHGILRDINEFGIAYEIVYESPHIGRIVFVPWHRIDEYTLTCSVEATVSGHRFFFGEWVR